MPLSLGPAIREQQFLTKPQFLDIAKWKTRRSQSKCARNSAEYIKAVTEAAFGTSDERLKIEVLTLLTGVSWPTASVILHFGARQQYPILDFRALWSLSGEVPAKGYSFDLWDEYCQTTRAMADNAGVTMRVLDRALWQYSKENQPPS
jgi:hypothetical protein